jgi:hypothetical protein
MKNHSRLFQIEQISFMGGADEISIKGRSIHDNLNFETEIRIEATMINLILNGLQKQNPEMIVADLVESEELPNGDCYYCLQTKELHNVLPVDLFSNSTRYRQIRA